MGRLVRLAWVDRPRRPRSVAAVDRIALCTITLGRPEGLARLLARLDELDRPEGTEFVAIVVDNDPEGSARAVVEAASVAGRPVVYDIEPVRGIPFARNRVLDLVAEAGADGLVWLDDDEVPAVDFVDRLHATLVETEADVVMGAPVAVFEPDAPEWLVDSGLMQAERFTSGQPYPYFHSRTCGLLMRTAVIPAERFEERMALSGGSDRLFFTRVERAGGRFVWNDEAEIEDHIPASRARVGWLIRRWFRVGVTRSLTLRYLEDPPWPRRLRRVAGGLLMAARGLVRTVIALPRGRAAILREFRLVCLGSGASLGILGYQYHEYRTIHGA